MNKKGQNPQPFKPIEGVVKLLGGIAGVAAGVSALVSVSGFLLLRAHAYLLGISSFLHHSVGEYAYEGGVFWISTIFWALPGSIVGNKYGWIAMGVITLYLIGKASGAINSLSKKVINILKLRDAVQHPWFGWACIVFATFLLLVFIYQMLPSSESKDLLFQLCNYSEIAKRTNKGAIEKLENNYVRLVSYIILSCVILWGIHKIHEGTEEGLLSIGRWFLYLLFTIQLVLLPINYGQTVYSNDFHKVSDLILDEELHGKIPRSENIWLLNQGADEYVFYFGGKSEIFLVKRAQVLKIAVKKRQNIFKCR